MRTTERNRIEEQESLNQKTTIDPVKAAENKSSKLKKSLPIELLNSPLSDQDRLDCLSFKSLTDLARSHSLEALATIVSIAADPPVPADSNDAVRTVTIFLAPVA